MRGLAIALCSLLYFLACSAQAQRPRMSQPQGEPIIRSLKQIEKTTKYKFFYPSDLFNESMLIDAGIAGAKRAESVDSFLSWLNVVWSVQGSIITIKGFRGPPPLLTGVSVDAVLDTVPRVQILDEVVHMPFTTMTQGQTTATIHQINAADISYNPVNNPIETLEGRVPGAIIRQVNGVPGSALQMRLEGRHSIQQGNDPLIVVDGVPWATNGFLNPIGSSSAQGPLGASAFNGIPMTAIASIAVMQGPAATALYGSRASNGVVIITLKEGRSGTLNWHVEVNGGVSRAVRQSPLLTISQFLALREEATRNDGLAVNKANIPELGWDTTHYSDFKRQAIGGAGVVQHAHVDLDWGSRRSWFLVSGRYYREASVFPGDSHDQHVSLYGNWHYQSGDKRWRIGVSSMADEEDVHLPRQDFSQFQYLAPNLPPFRNAEGRLQWGDSITPFVNLPAQTYNVYRGNVTTLLGHGQVSYEFQPFFFAELRAGYNGIFTREESLLRKLGQAPYIQPSPVDDTSRAHNDYNSGILEGLIRYRGPLGPGLLDAFAGVTYQGQRDAYSAFQAKEGVARTPGKTNESVYNRYEALFANVNYIFQKAYILSASMRWEGSSKFGPGYHYGSFGSVGAGWIFRQEAGGERVFSLGKIKGSYGATGNDQIGVTLYDTATAKMLNNHLRWELNRRAELGLDLGFAGNKVLFSVNMYRSWTKDQLIYSLPDRGVRGSARFTLMPANVLNEGVEFQLELRDIRLGPVRWTSQLALTVPRNVLKSFPLLDSTSLSATMVVGKSLSVTQGYHLTGVDPRTGYYTFQDIGAAGPGPKAKVAGPSLDARLFAGWCHVVSWRNWQLAVLLDWQVQNGLNPLAAIDARNPPGFQNPSQLSNGPVEWLQHWRQAGDHSSRMRVSAGNDGQFYAALGYYLQSDGLDRDASFLRVKNVALSYRWTRDQLRRSRYVEGMSVVLRGEDLWTVSRYPVTDAETQDPYVLPPVRVVSLGFGVSFRNKGKEKAGL